MDHKAKTRQQWRNEVPRWNESEWRPKGRTRSRLVPWAVVLMWLWINTYFHTIFNGSPFFTIIWVWVNTYSNTYFNGMNIHKSQLWLGVHGTSRHVTKYQGAMTHLDVIPIVYVWHGYKIVFCRTQMGLPSHRWSSWMLRIYPPVMWWLDDPSDVDTSTTHVAMSLILLSKKSTRRA